MTNKQSHEDGTLSEEEFGGWFAGRRADLESPRRPLPMSQNMDGDGKGDGRMG